MAAPQRKRARCENVSLSLTELVSARVPLHQLLAASEGPSNIHAAQAIQKRASRGLHAETKLDGPYGTLVKDMHIGSLVIQYLCPVALLHRLGCMTANFGNAISACDPQQIRKLCLYIDEVVPGNPFRPGKARAFQAVYWTLLGLPWFATLMLGSGRGGCHT